MEAPVLDRHSASPEPDPRGRPTRERRALRRIMRRLRIPIALYVGIVAVFFAIQTSLIFPGSETQGKPSSVVRPAPGTQLVSLRTGSDEKIVALFGPAQLPDGKPHPASDRRPTILYFYGNAMCLKDALFEFDHFRRLGVNVLIPEFVGYGMAEGKPSETGCRETADAAFAHLQGRKDVDPKRIVAAGWSLGGAVAIDLASRKPVAGLIAFCTFTSMTDMSRRSFPFVPASLLLRHRFDSLSRIGHVSSPILLGYGRRDEIVPIEMADRLSAAATHAPVMKFIVEDAGHNDFYAVGKDQIFQAMNRYLEQSFEER
jgi:esterase/lipase